MKLRIRGGLTARPVPTRAPRILGIDEFAFRKGRTYGTAIVDVESSRPVDVLPDRETSTVATWLQEFPGAEIICRDRLMALTKAIRQAARTRWRWQLAGTSSRTSRRPSRRPAVGTVTASDGQPDQR